MTARMVRETMTSLEGMENEMDLISPESGMLGQVRLSIGFVQISHTYTGIPSSSVAQINHRNELIMTTIGLAAIASAFQEAAMLYTWTNGYLGTKKQRIANQALAFIEGTGMDVCIKEYGLDLDPDALRSKFYRIFHVKKA